MSDSGLAHWPPRDRERREEIEKNPLLHTNGGRRPRLAQVDRLTPLRKHVNVMHNDLRGSHQDRSKRAKDDGVSLALGAMQHHCTASMHVSLPSVERACVGPWIDE